MLADERQLAATLEPLRERILRPHATAVSILAALQDAVHSWRITEELTPVDQSPLTIDDSSVEH